MNFDPTLRLFDYQYASFEVSLSFQDGKIGAGDSADTVLRLDSTGSSVPFRSIPKGMKRKWSSIEKSMGCQSVGSSLSLGRFVHSSSSSDSKGSSATACTRVSSAKETDEESSMALDLDFSLNLGNDKVASPKEPANKSLKVQTVKPKVDLELSLSTGPSESDVTSIYQGFPSFQLSMEKPFPFVETLNTDDGETSGCWKPVTSQPVAPPSLNPQVGYIFHSVTEKVVPPVNVPDLSSSILTMPKSSVTCTSGITQQQQVRFNRSSNSKICQVEGCGKGARGASGRCISHGGGRRCQKPGCHKGAEGRTVYCKAHGGGRRCQHLGCTKSAEGRTDHCIAHGGGRRCNREGCTRAARGKSGLCIRHGGGKRCQKENCTKSAEGLSGLCISHGGGRRCQMPGCTKGAQGSTMYCKAHGGGKRCTAPGCTKGAEGSTPFCKGHGGGKRCGFQGGGICSKSVHGGTNFCVAHGGGKRCAVPECTKSARGRTDYCVRHGGGKRCKFEGCGKSAQGSTDFCKAHGGGKRCSWGHPGSEYGTQHCCPCNSFARGKMGLCALHSGLVQDKRVHGGVSLGPNTQQPNLSKTEKMKDVVMEDYMNEDLIMVRGKMGPNLGKYAVSEAEKPSKSVLVPEGRVHGGSLLAMLACSSGLGSSSKNAASGQEQPMEHHTLPRSWV
ncbi:putative WRKY transcription factor 19 [Cucurbita argyrosperma subsp. argyrosperma]|nr:putative WRKY transcription factor 19 [Cucurbita argyrosperma subsp. argyrosperma]